MGAKNEKVILLVVLVASVAVALGSGGGVYFLSRKVSVLSQANAGLQARVATAQNKLNKLNDLRTERERAQARLDVAESILPSQEEIENLVDNLSEFARKSGVVITKAAPVRQTMYKSGKDAVRRFDEADFDLELVGNYFQFVEFLNYLENYKRFIRVDDFSVAAAKTEGEPDSIKLKFATFTYVNAVAPAAQKAAPAKGVTK